MQKRLMILGAGPSQLPLIQRAAELGFYVITVDYLPDNIGHKFSHQYVNCSTVDQVSVLNAARKLNINGIVTFASDVATPTVGFVAEQLGFPGGNAIAAQLMSNKARFRKFQQEHKLNCPRFITGQTFDEITDEISTLTPPLIFKPPDTSGSRGISKVDQLDSDLYLKAFKFAQSYSRSRLVCVEEYVEGIDVSGDGFMVNGHLYGVVTCKYKSDFVPTGHSLPAVISAEDQKRVMDEAEANCRALDYKYGPLDFDVRVSSERTTVLEMSPRLGGNGIPMIIDRSTDVDLIKVLIQFAVSEDIKFPPRLEVKRSCGSWIFGSDHAGKLERIATEVEVRSAIPEIFKYTVYYKIGDKIPKFIHSGHSMGFALFDCPPGKSYSEIVERIKKALFLYVSNSII